MEIALEKKKITQLSDEELIQGIIQTGSNKFVGTLYDRYANKIFRKCISLIHSEQQAEDLTHDIFIKILNKISTFKGDAKFSTWVYSITYNFCIDYIRKQKKIRLSQNQLSGQSESSYEMGETASENKEKLITRMYHILNLLKPEEELILRMKYMDKMSIVEIQQVFEISESAAKMRLKRAKEKAFALYTEKYN